MQAELPRICRREYLPTASKHHSVIELDYFLTSLLLLKTILLRLTLMVGIGRFKTETCGIEYEY